MKSLAWPFCVTVGQMALPEDVRVANNLPQPDISYLPSSNLHDGIFADRLFLVKNNEQSL